MAQIASNLQHRTATNIALWASELEGSLDDACERASQFGEFLIHYGDEKEAKAALTQFIERIYREAIPRWMRRDILFCMSQQFLEPDLEELAYEIVWGHDGGNEVYDQIASYHATSLEDLLQRCETLCPEAANRLNALRIKAQHYQQNAEYISGLKELADAIFYENGI